MNQNLLNTIILALVFLVLFATSEWLYHKKKVHAELTRKYVHLSTGLLTMLFPPLLKNHWLVLLLCSSFLVILIASQIFNLLPSINGVKRKTRGSFLFPVVVYVCYITYQYYGQHSFYYLPILVLAFADPAAALAGKKYRWKPYVILGHTKTVAGSLAFIAVAFLISFILLILQQKTGISIAVVTAVAVAMVSVFAEAFSHNGWDNFTIPMSALLVLISLKEFYLA